MAHGSRLMAHGQGEAQKTYHIRVALFFVLVFGHTEIIGRKTGTSTVRKPLHPQMQTAKNKQKLLDEHLHATACRPEARPQVWQHLAILMRLAL